MKRSAAMLLAALTILAAFAMSFAVFADDIPVVTDEGVTLNDPTCVFCEQPHNSYNYETHKIGLFSCTCCLECDYLDGTKLNKCARNSEGHYIGSREKMCCLNCTGFFPCACTDGDSECTCVYCGKKSQINEPAPTNVIPEKATNIFTTVVRTVTDKLSEVFSRLFEILFAIFGVNV